MKTVSVRNNTVRIRNNTVRMGGSGKLGGALASAQPFKKISDENVLSLKNALSRLSLGSGNKFIRL